MRYIYEQRGENLKKGEKENDYYTSQPSFGSKKTSRFWHQISRDVRIFVVIAACICVLFCIIAHDKYFGSFLGKYTRC